MCILNIMNMIIIPSLRCAAAKGRDPPPTLERLEALCEPGKEDVTLEHQLMRWVGVSPAHPLHPLP
jgi:hypothetical protein